MLLSLLATLSASMLEVIGRGFFPGLCALGAPAIRGTFGLLTIHFPSNSMLNFNFTVFNVVFTALII
jgi:hypothetical protein